MGKVMNLKFLLDDDKLELVESLKYLGLTFLRMLNG